MATSSTAAGAVIGRQSELDELGCLFEADGPTALVVEGEAGIGKTTVWLAGVDQAERAGYRVLRCRPAEAEEALPFVALGDLLEPVLDEALAELAGPQRAALETALLRVQPTEAYGRLAVSRAALTLLRKVALGAPTVLAIDDAQWLDPASADVLEFAVRRLADGAVRFLVARRTAIEQPPPLGLGRALDPERLITIRIGPLPVGELDRLLRANLDLRLPRPRLIELHSRAGGNPFYALEIARAAVRSNASDLRVPESLGALVRDRLDALPSAAREATLLVAASSNPSVQVVERAAEGINGIAEALRHDVLVLDGRRIRFSHPLLASVAYEAASPWDRRSIHARLAAAALDGEERARHLALATEEPDEPVASELEAAAATAAARGAPEAAAQLLEHAVTLTPAGADEDRGRRLAAAAEHHTASGDARRARGLLGDLARRLPAGPRRADVLWRLADLASDNLEDAVGLCRKALEEADGRPELEAEIELQLAVYAGLAYDLTTALEHCQRVIERAQRIGVDRLLATALAQSAYLKTILGRPAEKDLERAIALEQGVGSFPFLRPSFIRGWTLMLTDEPDQARPLLHAELERLSVAGHDATRPGAFFPLIELELRAGNWATAERHALEAVELAEQASVEQELGAMLVPHALVAAHLGRAEVARDAAVRALRRAEEGGDTVVAIRARGVLGFLELSLGEAEAAAGWLGPAMQKLVATGTAELSSYHVAQNQIDALLALGELDRAEELVALVERKGQSSGRAWHAAVAGRGRAQIAAARGDFAAAAAALEQALAAHASLPQPLELGRTLLAQGRIERRARHRREAREALTRALELFDDLGAPLWAEQTAAELARIPGRRASPSGLSETEQRVAELVAQGLTNKEVAARLFVTVRTVEANLSRIYAKLGVRSRAELAGRLGPSQNT